MPHDEVQTEILQRLTRVETKLDMQLNAKDIAAEALQSTKAAHHRLDSLQEVELKELRENQTWLWRTAVASLIVGAIGMLWKGVGG